MATYVMADIHGDLERYTKMLDKIDFNDNDTLIIAGDVIDRGANGLEIIQDIMTRENVEFLMGNHELIMLDALGISENIPEGYNWMGAWYHNGGRETAYRFSSMSKAEQSKVIEYLKRAEYGKYITVGDKKFYIVHGGPVGSDNRNEFKDFEHNVTWNRPVEWSYIPMKHVDHVIFGHTPTAYYQGCEGEHYTIYKSKRQPQLIGIDCGCKPGNIKGRLACLRLDDMAEFYV